MVNGYKPQTLAEALAIRAREKVIPYAGGTDLMVKNPQGAVYLFLNDIAQLREISDDGTHIRIGAAVTFTEALDSELVPPLMKEAVSRIAAPAIRNAGTFGGNLGNASDKADSVLAAFALDGMVRLVSKDGERLLPVEDFSLRRGVTALRDDELIAELLLPKRRCEMKYYYHKVGGRNALAISRIAFAATYASDGGRITELSIAVIGAGMFQRFRDLEKQMIGVPVSRVHENCGEYVQRYMERMQFTRGRVSAEYRRTVAENLLTDFFTTIG